MVPRGECAYPLVGYSVSCIPVYRWYPDLPKDSLLEFLGWYMIACAVCQWVGWVGQCHVSYVPTRPWSSIEWIVMNGDSNAKWCDGFWCDWKNRTMLNCVVSCVEIVVIDDRWLGLCDWKLPLAEKGYCKKEKRKIGWLIELCHCGRLKLRPRDCKKQSWKHVLFWKNCHGIGCPWLLMSTMEYENRFGFWIQNRIFRMWCYHSCSLHGTWIWAKDSLVHLWQIVERLMQQPIWVDGSSVDDLTTHMDTDVDTSGNLS